MAINWGNNQSGLGYEEAKRLASLRQSQPMTPQISDTRDARNLQQTQGADFGQYQTKLNQLLTDPSKVTQTGGYQFALDQGNQMINRGAAAKGMLGSGNVLAELAKYGQGLASQQYDTEANRLASLMQGAQRFGVATDYWKQPTYSGGGGGGSTLTWGNDPYSYPNLPKQNWGVNYG